MAYAWFGARSAGWVAVFACGLLLAACGDDSSAPADAGPVDAPADMGPAMVDSGGCMEGCADLPLWPLAVGYRWDYRSADGCSPSVEVVGESELGGRTAFEVHLRCMPDRPDDLLADPWIMFLSPDEGDRVLRWVDAVDRWDPYLETPVATDTAWSFDARSAEYSDVVATPAIVPLEGRDCWVQIIQPKSGVPAEVNEFCRGYGPVRRGEGSRSLRQLPNTH